jgi:hypothetical protein
MLYPTILNLSWDSNVALALEQALPSSDQKIRFSMPSGVTLEAGTPIIFGGGASAKLASGVYLGTREAWIDPLHESGPIAAGSVALIPDLGYASLVRAIQSARLQDEGVLAGPLPGVLKEAQPPAPEPTFLRLGREQLWRLLDADGVRFISDPDTGVIGAESNGKFFTAEENDDLARRTAARVLLGEL